ncbi:hypothetical protein [Mycetohabitans endofungorum]|uniref:hypothetical protein n=1 Tax=Mycetohabitans endofungorum TaxID=417203 RepID=UPI0030CC43C7
MIDMVTLSDKQINSAEALQSLPPGHVLGFFDLAKKEEDQLVHVMISTGHGKAAGNKNACLGFGQPSGWEELDLCQQPKLQWQDGKVNQLKDNGDVHRSLIVTHREISKIGHAPISEQPSGQASTLAQA